MLVAAPPHITKEPMSTAIEIMHNGSLPCVASGKPEPKISWQRADGRAIDFDSGRFLQSRNGSLVLKGKRSINCD
jgi:hypothetical protein